MSTKSETVKLKNIDLLASVQALNQLDEIHFNAKTTLALVRVALTLKQAAEAITTTRDRIAKKHFGSNNVSQDDPRFLQFQAEVQTVFNEETDLGKIKKISLDENGLDIDKNKIPLTVLVNLSWLVDLA